MKQAIKCLLVAIKYALCPQEFGHPGARRARASWHVSSCDGAGHRISIAGYAPNPFGAPMGSRPRVQTEWGWTSSFSGPPVGEAQIHLGASSREAFILPSNVSPDVMSTWTTQRGRQNQSQARRDGSEPLYNRVEYASHAVWDRQPNPRSV